MAKNFLKYFGLITLLTFSVSSPAIAQSEGNPPNIILILADDLGYGDLGSYGQQSIKTPNLDRMAAEGVQFNQFYSGSPVCRPARCTIITGLHTGNCYARANDIDLNLRLKDITIAEILKEKDYKTAAIGKWALGEENTTGIPENQGFDYFYGYLNQIHAHNYYPEYLIENNKRISLKNKVENPGKYGEGKASIKKEYTNDLFTDKALDFIDTHKDKPFFLYLPYTLPHANNEANELEVPDLLAYEKKQWPESSKAYAAMVTRLDTYVGNILDKLKQHQLDQNTIIIFTSDNGPHEEGGFDPEYFNSNSNLRGIKRDLFEGGIRVPLLVWGPGIVQKSDASNHISYFPDIFSTVADIANIDIEHSIDGVSFLPTLIGDQTQQEKHQYLYWELHEGGGSRAVRTGDWKSVTKPYGGTPELYNLKTDISESNNVASQQPDIVLKHQEIMDAAHSDLPPLEGFQVFLERENVFGKRNLFSIGVLITMFLFAFYIFKKKYSGSKGYKL